MRLFMRGKIYKTTDYISGDEKVEIKAIVIDWRQI